MLSVQTDHFWTFESDVRLGICGGFPNHLLKCAVECYFETFDVILEILVLGNQL